MSTWFAAAAVAPVLAREWSLSAGDLALLTVATQLGFVVGALSIAVTGLTDLVAPHRVLAIAAAAAAIANVALPLADGHLVPALLLRFAVGAALAGVYPTGMKLLATWFDRSRGLAIGTLVGAITLATASPHGLAGIGADVSWTVVIALTTASAGAAAIIAALWVRAGPHESRAQRLDLRAAVRALREPSLRLANLGYLGHMWELYAMWTWLPAYLTASFALRGVDAPIVVSAVAVAAIGAGALGCVGAGLVADRVGRTATTSAAMAVSGSSAVLAGLLFGADPALVTIVAIIWGISVVADSAQFSAAITELAPADRVGSSLALQTALGFLLTTVTIQLVPIATDAWGWSGAFTLLAIGPALGVVAMLRLRRLPQARRMAHGRR